jgi:drug/metabolite transporter (DMT)-like permease
MRHSAQAPSPAWKTVQAQHRRETSPPFWQRGRHFFLAVFSGPASCSDEKPQSSAPHEDAHLMMLPSFFVSFLKYFGCIKLESIGNIYGGCLVIFVSLLRTTSSSLIHGFPKTFPSLQLIFIESLFGLSFFILFFRKKTLELFKTRAFFLQFVKALTNICGTFFLFEGLRHLPLAISSLLSLSSIFFGILGAFLFFSEKPAPLLLFSLFLSLSGFSFLFHGSGGIFSWSSLYPIGAAACFSLSTLVSKKIALSDSLATSLLYIFSLQSVVTALPCFWSWQPMAIGHFEALAFTALVLALSVPLTLQAESFASIAFLMPFKPLRIVWALLLGWAFHQETLHIYDLCGGACVIASSSLALMNSSRTPSFYFRRRGRALLHYGEN